MTTPIAPGDLVLAHNNAVEVMMVGKDNLLLVGMDWVRLSDATRIGSTRDGWRIHTGSERPEGVGADDRVQTFMTGNGLVTHSGIASDIRWNNDARAEPLKIVAYRVVSRAEPPAPDRDAELKAVAAEMRRFMSGAERTHLRAWADRIDPPKPEPLKVGDTVTTSSDPEGKVLWTDAVDAVVLWETGNKTLTLVSTLERIP